MDLNSKAVLLGAAGAGPILPNINIGDFYEGGYFAGYISQNANGVPTHGLIVNQNQTVGNYEWKTSNTSSPGTQSVYDGEANTNNMTSNHPAAIYCLGLTTNGYTDWYLPALYELEIAYYNLKPSTDSNSTSVGTNLYSVPSRNTNYTTTVPPQTTVASFQQGNSLAFIRNETYWTSTEFDTTRAYQINFGTGALVYQPKTTYGYMYTRAFRKFAV